MVRAGPLVIWMDGAEFVGQDRGEGGLAEAGRAVEEDVAERLLELARGVDGDLEPFGDALLADDLAEQLRPQGGVALLVFSVGRGADHFLAGHALVSSPGGALVEWNSAG